MLQKYALNPDLSIWEGSEPDLKDRYPFASPEELGSIAADTHRENKLVGGLISDSGLSSWSKGIFGEAKLALGGDEDQIKYTEDHEMTNRPQTQGDVIIEDSIME